jgi:hypothetical protein
LIQKRLRGYTGYTFFRLEAKWGVAPYVAVFEWRSTLARDRRSPVGFIVPCQPQQSREAFMNPTDISVEIDGRTYGGRSYNVVLPGLSDDVKILVR